MSMSSKNENENAAHRPPPPRAASLSTSAPVHVSTKKTNGDCDGLDRHISHRHSNHNNYKYTKLLSTNTSTLWRLVIMGGIKLQFIDE
jgi:hypothetical protein